MPFFTPRYPLRSARKPASIDEIINDNVIDARGCGNLWEPTKFSTLNKLRKYKQRDLFASHAKRLGKTKQDILKMMDLSVNPREYPNYPFNRPATAPAPKRLSQMRHDLYNESKIQQQMQKVYINNRINEANKIRFNRELQRTMQEFTRAQSRRTEELERRVESRAISRMSMSATPITTDRRARPWTAHPRKTSNWSGKQNALPRPMSGLPRKRLPTTSHQYRSPREHFQVEAWSEEPKEADRRNVIEEFEANLDRPEDEKTDRRPSEELSDSEERTPTPSLREDWKLPTSPSPTRPWTSDRPPTRPESSDMFNFGAWQSKFPKSPVFKTIQNQWALQQSYMDDDLIENNPAVNRREELLNCMRIKLALAKKGINIKRTTLERALVTPEASSLDMEERKRFPKPGFALIKNEDIKEETVDKNKRRKKKKGGKKKKGKGKKKNSKRR